jgi:CBS-domain-containing membrane protein
LGDNIACTNSFKRDNDMTIIPSEDRNNMLYALRAEDIMTTNVVTIYPETIITAIVQKLLDHKIGALPVIDKERRVVGIVSEGDLIGRVDRENKAPQFWWRWLFVSREENARSYLKNFGIRASDVMTREVITADRDAPLSEIAQLLEEKRIKRVPIISDGKLIGIVSRANILQGIATNSAKRHGDYRHDDSSLKNSIERVIEKEDICNPSDINVIVSGGIAHLWGVLESQIVSDAVEAAARATLGILDVVNHVRIPDNTWRDSRGG